MAGLVEGKAEKSQRWDSEAAQGREAAAATPWLGHRFRESARRQSHCLRCPRLGGEGVGVDTKVGGTTGGAPSTPDDAAWKTFGSSQGPFPTSAITLDF